jgi:hypothetical protein
MNDGGKEIGKSKMEVEERERELKEYREEVKKRTNRLIMCAREERRRTCKMREGKDAREGRKVEERGDTLLNPKRRPEEPPPAPALHPFDDPLESRPHPSLVDSTLEPTTTIRFSPQVTCESAARGRFRARRSGSENERREIGCL